MSGNHLFIAVFCACCTLLSGCSKEELLPVEPVNDENLIVVEHSSFGIDSIFYEDAIIKSFSVYKKSNDKMICEASYELLQQGDEIEVSRSGSKNGNDIFIFRNQVLTEIRGAGNMLNLSFFYNNGKLEYFLYKRYESVDSISVKTFKNSQNISRMEWYRISNNTSSLLFISDYTLDDKRNPFHNSIYWMAKNWKGPDDVISYFNDNNILSIGSHKFSYGYNMNEYPVYMDISTFGRTIFHYRSREDANLDL